MQTHTCEVYHETPLNCMLSDFPILFCSRQTRPHFAQFTPACGTLITSTAAICSAQGIAGQSARRGGGEYPFRSNEKSPSPAITQPPTTRPTDIAMGLGGSSLLIHDCTERTQQVPSKCMCRSQMPHQYWAGLLAATNTVQAGFHKYCASRVPAAKAERVVLFSMQIY
jgi:hypothetical protein